MLNVIFHIRLTLLNCPFCTLSLNRLLCFVKALIFFGFQDKSFTPGESEYVSDSDITSTEDKSPTSKLANTTKTTAHFQVCVKNETVENYSKTRLGQAPLTINLVETECFRVMSEWAHWSFSITFCNSSLNRSDIVTYLWGHITIFNQEHRLSIWEQDSLLSHWNIVMLSLKTGQHCIWHSIGWRNFERHLSQQPKST